MDSISEGLAKTSAGHPKWSIPIIGNWFSPWFSNIQVGCLEPGYFTHFCWFGRVEINWKSNFWRCIGGPFLTQDTQHGPRLHRQLITHLISDVNLSKTFTCLGNLLDFQKFQKSMFFWGTPPHLQEDFLFLVMTWRSYIDSYTILV